MSATNLNYYYSGPQERPTAIMGLNKKYVLDNDLWHPIASTAMCVELFQCMKTKDVKNAVRDLRGYTMKAPDGQPLGVWLSDADATMAVKLGPGNKVIVYTPDVAMPSNMKMND